MGYKWISSTKYKGVRYHQHETRRHGAAFDKLFAIRYQLDGKRHENILGWASNDWTEKKAFVELENLKEAYRLGKGAVSLSEKRKEANKKKEEEKRLQQELAKSTITFSRFWDTTYWLSQQHKKSIGSEKILYEKWIKPAIGNKALMEIKPSDLEVIKKKMMDEGKSASTIKYIFAIISQVWTVAKNEERVHTDSPTRKVNLAKKDNRRERFLTPEEARTLLTHLKRQSLQTHNMAVIALYCGLRFGEVAALQWQNVNFEEETLSIRDAKSNVNRKAFLPAAALHMLKEYKELLLASEKTVSGYIFPSRTGGRMGKVSNTFRNVANKLFNEDIEDARQKVCFHTLRHTFASWLVQRGVDLYSVKELMGHADFKMTQRYSHLSPDGLRKATLVLND